MWFARTSLFLQACFFFTHTLLPKEQPLLEVKNELLCMRLFWWESGGIWYAVELVTSATGYSEELGKERRASRWSNIFPVTQLWYRNALRSWALDTLNSYGYKHYTRSGRSAIPFITIMGSGSGHEKRISTVFTTFYLQEGLRFDFFLDLPKPLYLGFRYKVGVEEHRGLKLTSSTPSTHPPMKIRQYVWCKGCAVQSQHDMLGS